MKGYKGFDKDFTCRGKQYAENTVFEEDTAEVCRSGMHFCKNAFDVWRFYPPCNSGGKLSTYAEVEALSDIKTDDQMKFCTTKLKVGSKLSLHDFIKVGVDDIVRSCGDFETNTGDCSAATNTGDCSAATNTGDWSAATNTGDWSAAIVQGDQSIAVAAGNHGKAKGAKGCWIVCAERDTIGDIICVKSAQVDGKVIKANTFYTLKDGKFVEVNNQ